MSKGIQDYLDTVREKGKAICDAVEDEIAKLGLQDKIVAPVLDEADYLLCRDPLSGENSLMGTWRDDRGQKRGEITFHADGSFYAEYDVVRVHPKQHQWFIEAITAWGNQSVIKTEPKLLPVIG